MKNESDVTLAAVSWAVSALPPAGGRGDGKSLCTLKIRHNYVLYLYMSIHNLEASACLLGQKQEQKLSALLSFTTLTTSIVITTTSMTTIATVAVILQSWVHRRMSSQTQRWKDDIIPPSLSLSLFRLVTLRGTADRAEKQGASSSDDAIRWRLCRNRQLLPPTASRRRPRQESWHNFHAAEQ